LSREVQLDRTEIETEQRAALPFEL
jgi:hypothetical protein